MLHMMQTHQLSCSSLLKLSALLAGVQSLLLSWCCSSDHLDIRQEDANGGSWPNKQSHIQRSVPTALLTSLQTPSVSRHLHS
jgi:hypothetical protein